MNLEQHFQAQHFANGYQLVKIECPKCHGNEQLIDKGELVETTTVETRRGQSGDAAHLRVAVDCIKQMAIIEGICAEPGSVSAQQNNIMIGGENTFNVAAFMQQIEDNVPGWAEHSKNALLAEYEEDCRKADERQGKVIEVKAEAKHEGNGAA